MPLLLNIDTATEVASVCITRNGESLALVINECQKEHASFVHTAIDELLNIAGCKLKDIEAFAVTSGPGSYTGLRVGMATAKGFCYALSKPLVAINTLEVMAKAAIDSGTRAKQNLLFCPMIDARRMEVFTAIYNSDMGNIFPPAALILEEKLFASYMINNRILFFGSGSRKFKEMQTHLNSEFEEIRYDARHLGVLAEIAVQKKLFSDLTYAEPTYFKEFHSISARPKHIFSTT